MTRNFLSVSFKSSVSVLALGSLALGNLALAQAADDDEIIVTARKQAETLIEVPVAVSAFTENSIEDLGLQSVDDVARHTAGFSFSKAFGRTTERPVIRGAANILAGVQFGVEAGAAYFVDGVYYSGDLQALDTRNIERIEVIKGAQSALYGRNTYSGAINFISKRPSQDGFEASLEALAAEDPRPEDLFSHDFAPSPITEEQGERSRRAVQFGVCPTSSFKPERKLFAQIKRFSLADCGQRKGIFQRRFLQTFEPP